MKLTKLAFVLFFAVGLILFLNRPRTVTGQTTTEAPTGFDGKTNGLVNQATYNDDLRIFSQRKPKIDGLGPVYNAQACIECHQNPIAGGNSQVTDLRAGHFDGLNFVPHPGGTLISDRAIDPSIQEQILAGNGVRTFRISPSLLGGGFIETIDSNILLAISNSQPAAQRGTIVSVSMLEAPDQTRVGRFGWKNQHASLLSAAADFYLNEIGITSPLLPNENSSNGSPVALFDIAPDPEDDGLGVESLARFIRSTKAPPRDPELAANVFAIHGSQLFTQIGCAVCHVPTITTAPVGTAINGGQFVVPTALGDKIIHPFSDFLLHNVQTGDGIVQEGMPQSTRNMIRTPPLWGIRTRTRFMHNGQSITLHEAIVAHGGQAEAAKIRYIALSLGFQSDLRTFLSSL